MEACGELVAFWGAALRGFSLAAFNDWCMAREYRSVDRDTPFLLPPDMRDWLPSGHLALFVIDVVTRLDTAALHAGPKRGGTGRKGYDPDMLLGLWLYASARGITSSRQIERACVEDVAFRVLCAQDAPDHTVLARFLQRYRPDMEELFTQMLALCLRAGMGKFGQVALDGTKIRASAATDQTRSLKTLRKLAAAELLKAVATDRAEDEAGVDLSDHVPTEFIGSDRADRIQAAIESVEELIQEDVGVPLEAARAKARAAAEVVKEVDEAQDALVAKYEAKKAAGKTPMGRRPIPGVGQKGRAARVALAFINRQVARLEQQQSELLAGNQVKDVRMAQRNTTDPESRVMKTRNGYIQGYNSQIVCSDDFLVMVAEATNDPSDRSWFVPMMEKTVQTMEDLSVRTGRADVKIGTMTSDAGYISDEAVEAEGPDRLIAPGRGRVNDTGWKGTTSNGGTSVNLMAEKLQDPVNQALYKRRSATIETSNAHIKDGRGLRQFTVRGLAAVQAQLHLAAMATNLTRLFNKGIPLPVIA